MYQFIWWSIPTVFTHHPTHPFFFYLTPSHNIRMWSYPPVHTLKGKKNHALNNDLYLLRLYCLLEVPVSWQHTKQKNLERDAASTDWWRKTPKTKTAQFLLSITGFNYIPSWFRLVNLIRSVSWWIQCVTYSERCPIMISD